MNFKKIFQQLICLLLVALIFINCTPIKTEATAITAGTIAAVSAVNVPAALAIGAGAITLGVMVGERSDDLQNMVSNAASSLTDFVKDGTVELMRVVDEAGTATYYAAGDLLEGLRSNLISSSSVYQNPVLNDVTVHSDVVPFGGYYFSGKSLITVEFLSFTKGTNTWGYNYSVYLVSCVPDAPLYWGSSPSSVTNEHSSSILYIDGKNYRYAYSTTGSSCNDPSDIIAKYPKAHVVDAGKNDAKPYVSAYLANSDSYLSDLDVTLGQFPSVPVDGTSARQWSEEYTDKGLYVIGGGNNSDPGAESGKWYWPLALAANIAALLSLSQADQWSGVTPSDFSEYLPAIEYTIISRPEVDFGAGLEIFPVISPGTGSDSEGVDVPYIPDIAAGVIGIASTVILISEALTNIKDIVIDWFTVKWAAFVTWFMDTLTAIKEGVLAIPDIIVDAIATVGAAVVSIWEWLTTTFGALIDTIIGILSDILAWALGLVEALVVALEALLVKIFVPDMAVIEDAVADLRAQFPFFDSIIITGQYLLNGITSGTPPVIYMHLEDAEGALNWGGTVAVLDMSFYSRYKAAGDLIMSSCLLTVFAWRTFKRLPGIISGAGSDIQVFKEV